jgi:rubrerythrin
VKGDKVMADNRIEALRQALKMEEDGKAYYEAALNRVKSELAREIFRHLIKAEIRHVEKIEQLYASLEETGKWPNVILTRNRGETVDNIFSEVLANVDDKVKGTTTDIEALKIAVEMEDQGIKYYQSKADMVDDPFEKKFYHLLVREEGEHFISLLDTIEYLEDPQGYFSQLERGTMSF